MKGYKATAGLVVGLLLLQSAVLWSGASAQDGFRALFDTARNFKRLTRENERPPMPSDPCVEQVASEIDWLEHLIETHGTAVAKHPDVWGEARLAQYRADYEREIIKKLDACQFDAGIQASLRRSDTSSLALALALNAAADKGAAGNQAAAMIGLPIVTDEGKVVVPPSAKSQSTSQSSAVQGSGELGLEPIVQLNQLSDYLNHINALRRRNEGDDTADSPGYALNLLRIPVSVFPGKHTREGYGAETTFTLRPILSDDLLPTTMRDLIINDVVEQNALPLSQVFNNEPARAKELLDGFEANTGRVSQWLLGYDAWLETVARESENCSTAAESLAYLEGYREYFAFRLLQIAQLASSGAAENACSIKLRDATTLELTWGDIANALDALFPTPPADKPFNYVYPIVSVKATIEDIPASILIQLMNAKELGERRLDLSPYEPIVVAPSRETIVTFIRREGEKAGLQAGNAPIQRTIGFIEKTCEYGQLADVPKPESKRLRERSSSFLKKANSIVESQFQQAAIDQIKENLKLALSSLTSLDPMDSSAFAPASGPRSQVIQYQNDVSAALDQLQGSGGTGAFAGYVFVRAGNGLTPAGAKRERAMSPAQYPLVYGTMAFHRIANEALLNLRRNPANDKVIHILDIRQVLRSEAEAAYRLLGPQPGGTHAANAYRGFWDVASPELAHAIRHQDFARIRRTRENFFREFYGYHRHMITGSLAWGILVEAALLNDRLTEDMQSLAAAKGMMPQIQMGLSFVGPREMLTPEAQEAFKAYVAQRWPPIVFALDPSKTEQNVADAFASRRELQLAISVAVANGEMSAGAAGRFMRELELDVETVALNPTQVAFSHGNDTFGWRFYPRLQTPDTPGNIQAFGENLFGVGPTRKDCFLRQQRLEPGLRECTAVVVMPSFVPYATLECRTNWFALTNPEKKVLTLHDSMRISRAYQSIQQVVHCPADHGHYRPQDVSFLGSALTQLEKRMPLQSMTVGIPYENTLGGFDMFATGVTGLGPQLDGWYGAPGIRLGDVKASESRKVVEQTTCPKGGSSSSASERRVCDNSGTTIFLVGDRFSPLASKTRVIAGGRCCEFRLLSRQVLEVTVPPDALPLRLEGKGQPPVVDVHVATPYGPTNHLLIPVAWTQADAASAATEKTIKELTEKVDLLESNVPSADWNVEEVTIAATYDNCKLTGQCLCESLKVTVKPTGRGGSTAAGDDPILELRAGKPHFASSTKTSQHHTLRKGAKGAYAASEVFPKLISDLVAKAESPELRCGLGTTEGQAVTFEVEGVLYPMNGDSPIKIERPLRVKIIGERTADPCEGCKPTALAGGQSSPSTLDCPESGPAPAALTEELPEIPREKESTPPSPAAGVLPLPTPPLTMPPK